MLNIGVIRSSRLSGLPMVGSRLGALRFSEMVSVPCYVGIRRQYTPSSIQALYDLVERLYAQLTLTSALCLRPCQLNEPYADNPGSRGFMRIDQQVLTTTIHRFLRDGWQTVRSACLTPLRYSRVVFRTSMPSVIEQIPLFSMHSSLPSKALM
jgi:hypothetical protein